MADRKRDFEKEYRDYHSKPDQKKNRAMRNAARADAEKKGLVKKGDGLEVDHIRPIRDGGKNTPKNTRVISKKRNRGWADGKV